MSKQEQQAPPIGVIMGSDSDLGVMAHAERAFNEAGLKLNEDYEFGVKSAHRTPKAMMEYAETAEERGVKVIIAGAGGSAHLPGMVASETLLPVLGVAITKNERIMNPALGSMIRMPKGTPLATFQASGGAYKAGALAARIIRPEIAPVKRGVPRIGIVSSRREGSLTAAAQAADALTDLGLRHNLDFEVLSRSIGDKQQLADYAGVAELDGKRVIISCAAYASKLLSTNAKLPVLGVAVTNREDRMNNELERIIHKLGRLAPVPAFQGPSGAYNAGLAAARILIPSDPKLRESYVGFLDDMASTVGEKDAKLRALGPQAYLDQM